MAENLRTKVLNDIEMEEVFAKKSLNRSMFSRLVPLLHPVRSRVAAAIGIEILLVTAIFLRPWLIRLLIDKGLIRQGGGWAVQYDYVQWLAFAMALTWAARFILAGVSQYLAGSAAIRVLNDLRVRVFSHIQSLSVRYFDRTKAGRIISRADRDVDSLEPLLIQGPPELLSALLRSIVAGVLMWRISPLLFLSLASVVPFLLAGTWAFKRISQRNWAIVAENRSRFTAHLVETVSGVRLLQQTVQEEPNRKRYRGFQNLGGKPP